MPAFGVAQTGTSRVTGQILDQSGAAIADAKVTLTNDATGIDYQTKSTDAGLYLYDALQPGSYSIKVEKEGFKTYISHANVLTVGIPLTLNVKLEVGTATSTVEVTSTYERVQTSTSGNLGAVVDNRTLTDLPLGLDLSTGGRNPLVFSHLQPGVNVGANTGSGVHFNGARDRAVNYTLDGIDINESSAGGGDSSPLRTNPDDLQEFRVITSNPTAQYGRSSGAQVELVTKSGTNQIHGNLFYFHRNNGFSANEWENNFNGLARPKLVQHQWGGSVGGPVLKNRTFYFFNYQQQRQVRPFTRTRTVYTATARQGMFRYVAGGQNLNAGGKQPSVDAAGNPRLPNCSATVTANCIATYNIVANDPRALGLDPTIRDKWIGLTPLPNSFFSGDGLNTAGFVFSGGRLDPQRDFLVKIDHRFNEKNSIYGRYGWGEEDTINDTTNLGEPRFPGLPTIVNTTRSPRNLALGYRRVINPHLVNELIGGANHFTFNFVIPDAGQTLPFVTVNVTDPLTNDRGNLRTLNTYQVIDNLSYDHGAHAFRFGTNFRYTQHRDIRGSVGGFDSELEVILGGPVNSNCLAGGPGVNASGQEFFCLPTLGGSTGINTSDRTRLIGTINDLLGRINSIQRGFVASNDLQSFLAAGTTFFSDVRFGEYDFYGQDTWKWKPNFTVDVGLRIEMRTHPLSPNNRLFQPNQAVRVGEAPSNTLKWVRGSLYGNDLANFEPSIGFAWDPFETGKTSVRANYRLASDRINTFVLSSQIFNTVPGLTLGVQDLAFGQSGGPGATGGRWRDNIPNIAPAAGLTPQSLTQPSPFGTTGITVVDPAFHAPRTSMWQLSVQREAWKNIVIDAAYIGRHATGLLGAYDINQVEYRTNGFLDAFRIVQAGGESALINQIYGPDARRQAGESGSAMIRRMFTNAVNNGSVGSVANDAATRIQGGKSLLELAGLSPFFFKPYPQFSGSTVGSGTGFLVLDSNDYSNYHALQLTASRKFTSGVTFQAAYTLGKSLDVRSFDPAFSVVSRGTLQSAGNSPFDIRNRRLNYARSDFDRRHIFTGYAVWDLPFGKGHFVGASVPNWLRAWIEGWQINGDFVVESGRPFTVYSGFNQFTNVVSSPANCSGCSHDMGHVDKRSATFAGVPGYFDSSELAKFSQPGAGELGNTGRNFFTGPRFFNIDAALLKRTKIGEGRNLELRLEAFNVTNTPSFGFPGAIIPATDDQSTTFGRIRDNLESSSRKLRIGVKFNF